MAVAKGKPMFPCPVCTQPREVRVTKKGKPHLVCDPCGIQVFIRGSAGIEEFKRLLERTNDPSLLGPLKEMEQRYRLTCSECGCRFWIEPETGVFDGSLKGFRCPKKGCGGIVPWKKKE